MAAQPEITWRKALDGWTCGWRAEMFTPLLPADDGASAGEAIMAAAASPVLNGAPAEVRALVEASGPDGSSPG